MGVGLLGLAFGGHFVIPGSFCCWYYSHSGLLDAGLFILGFLLIAGL